MLPSAYALPEIIRKAVAKEIDIFFSYSFIILFSGCKITQSPMQPICKDESEASSLEITSANIVLNACCSICKDNHRY